MVIKLNRTYKFQFKQITFKVSTMGRRQRKRRCRKEQNYRTCDDSKEVVLLNSWLAKEGMRRNSKLVLAIFDDTGRGVMTKKKIVAGEELMNLPLNSTINVTTILMDLTFCGIFLENKCRYLSDYKQKVSFQSLMAFYLSYLKLCASPTKWSIYLKSLPEEYTVPYFLPNEIQHYIDPSIKTVILNQKHIIEKSFNIFVDILKLSRSSNSDILKFKECFNVSVYEWAYFTVNTRCVYMDLSKLIDLKNVGNCILNIVSDNTKISLCPYLDMINHNANARNETKLMVAKDIANINVTNLNEDLFSDVWFSIYTKNNFDPFTQVFICYGDSHNLKLITEYGFYLPANELDYVQFDYESVIAYLKSISVRLSQEQISFVNSHGLNKDLYIDSRGLSFNLYGLLMVVKYYYNHSTDVSRLIYSAAICSDDKALNELVKPMARNKLDEVKESICKLESFNYERVILTNCVALMSHYVDILEKFIKC